MVQGWAEWGEVMERCRHPRSSGLWLGQHGLKPILQGCLVGLISRKDAEAQGVFLSGSAALRETDRLSFAPLGLWMGGSNPRACALGYNSFAPPGLTGMRCRMYRCPSVVIGG